MIIHRVARDDWDDVQSIVNYYIENSVANLKLEVLTEAEFDSWIRKFVDHGPHQMLVAKADVNAPVIGFACSSQFNPRGGYRQTVWTSVYLQPNQTQRGVGTALYTRLFEHLNDEPLHRVMAGITLPNEASVALHHSFGFKRIGVLNEVGHKSNQYHDVLWMEKHMSYREE
jgi:phosphinothricin acetyltransferase